MGLPTVMSRDEVDKTTLGEIAEACHVSPGQIEDIYVCTPLQNRTMAESGIHSGASVIRLVLSLGADLDRDRWCAALRRVVSLNPVLRTRLVDCRFGLMQVVTNEEHYTRCLSEDVEQYIRDDEAQPFDLGVPLFRSAIIDRNLVLTMHHAVMDHSSMASLSTDIIRIYGGHAPEVRASFKAFVAYCLGIDKSAARSFWASRFKGAPAIFPKVKTGYTPHATQKMTRMITSNRIGAEVALAHIPLFIEASWALTAAAYAGSESVAYGLVLSGRTPALAGLETTLGPTITVVPIQVNVQRNMIVGEMIRERATALRRTVQEKLILRVHEEIGLSPSETPVIEGHGTGTQAGDPIEAGAFMAVLARERTPSNPLYIGSIKSNIGHLKGTSGILGMVKAIMMIQHGCILPNAGFEEFSQNIEGREKLKVATTTLPWPHNMPKRVLVTNFGEDRHLYAHGGFGGSNAAVLLEEAPTILRPSREFSNGTGHTNGISTNGISTNGTGPTVAIVGHDHANGDSVRRLFVLSAKLESSLTSYLSSFREYLDTGPESSSFATDLSYTLGQRRTHYAYRVAVTANSVSSLKDQLLTCKTSKAKDRSIAYAFTGQGAQHAQMATGLRRYKPFTTAISQAEAYLHTMGASWYLTEELNKQAPESRINNAEISQPACTAVQLALVILLKSWGVAP
ncbi:hypothetical protein B7463_g11705, partial [Scytalidium lignicola]